MPTLEEVLKYFCEPAVKHMWLLLDIKMDNDPNQVMTAIAATVHKVNSGGVSFWGRRIVLGCWAPSFIPVR
jgi:phosphatidylglycerol phospholipase C